MTGQAFENLAKSRYFGVFSPLRVITPAKIVKFGAILSVHILLSLFTLIHYIVVPGPGLAFIYYACIYACIYKGSQDLNDHSQGFPYGFSTWHLGCNLFLTISYGVFNIQNKTRQCFCMNYIDHACMHAGTNIFKILQGS